MRLNSIKLSGFKSFADPTHFPLPGQLVGVVGPNGCGKSNIMDAVRWVLGESKASELRGDSMQDVIFNGSGQRKPASRASVELAFSNEDGRAGGPWNRFAEIAVKRVLTRDGTSSYYINSQPVRRRDVQDVFLGTGLGPRAYAIIGQGTISRIIESRPEELRLFLEEAAGVSKYKERRRETESRLRDTRENLARVEDILRELNGNLDKLELQAEVAGRYRQLQALGELKLHQLRFLKHRDAAAEEARVQALAQGAATALEACTAQLRSHEAELDAVRRAHYVAGDDLHGAQAALAEAALEVSRLEERIRYVLEGRTRVQSRLADLRAQIAAWGQRREAAAAEIDAVGVRIAAANDAAELLSAQVEEHADQVPTLADALRTAQQRAGAQRDEATSLQQQIQLLGAESRGIGEQRRQLEGRRDRLSTEQSQLAAPDTQALAQLQGEAAAADEVHALMQACLHDLAEQVPALDDDRRAVRAQADAEGRRQVNLSARLDALRALQEKVQTDGRLTPWLARHGLAGLAPLWSRLHVEPGWETALEAALRERLGALEVGRLDAVQAFAGDPPPAKLTLHTAAAAAPGAATGANLPRLVDRLRLGDAALKGLLADWLGGIHTAATLDEAFAARASLGFGEAILTPAGHSVSRFGVGFYAPDSEQAGLLARAQDIENLDREVRAQTLLADTSRSTLVRADAAYADASQRLAAARREATGAQSRAHTAQVELLRATQRSEQVDARRLRLDEELGEVGAQLDELAERSAVAEARFEELDLQRGAAQERRAELDDAAAAAERRLGDAREQFRAIERRAQEAQFAARSLAARHAEMQREVDTATAQLDAGARAEAELQTELDQLADAGAPAGLQQALSERLAREATLAARRSEYDDLSVRLRRADEARLAAEHGLAPLRERITQFQLEAQAAQLGGAQHLEQLAAAGADLGALERGIRDDGVKLFGLQAEIDRTQREIALLGAVNLAALDELAAARERKTFLDAQNADLVEAMTTLENAIREIDRETRNLLAATFDQVNAHFGRMFPSLFGGGNARLVMTGEEVLDAGVHVMAQPPGKKNSTIHLLSGGEKALTAIALVFAIFQLNPAPFCLLDEVDAPLDDANTERYAKLVQSMAQSTQFLFISHNKLAMEMAGQLIGVTMQEQGVSRIVAVDMQAAAGFAQAA